MDMKRVYVIDDAHLSFAQGNNYAELIGDRISSWVIMDQLENSANYNQISRHPSSRHQIGSISTLILTVCNPSMFYPQQATDVTNKILRYILREKMGEK